MVIQYGVPIVMAGVRIARWMHPIVRKVISAHKSGTNLQAYRTKLIEKFGHAKNDVNKAFKLAKEVMKNQAKPKVVKPKIKQIKKYADKLGTKEGTTFSKGPLYGSPLKNPRALNLAYRRMLSEKVKEGITKKKLSGNRTGGSISKYSKGGGVRKPKY
jgi:hypothetical protein